MKLAIITNLALAAGILGVPQPALEEKRQPELPSGPELRLVQRRNIEVATSAGILLDVREFGLEERQTGLGDLIFVAISTLESVVSQSVANIQDLVTGIGGNLNASLAIVASLSANLEGIQQALQAAITSVLGSLTGAFGGIIGAALGFTDTQVAALQNALITLESIISQIAITLTLQATDLAPAVLNTLRAEIQAIQSIIVPLLAPLQSLVQAIRDFNINTNVEVTGLEDILGQLGDIALGIIRSLFGI